MITLTAEQAQQIEEALKEVRFAAIERCDSVIPSCDKALATIRAARSQAQEPVAANCPKCKSEISHWSWCPDFVQPVSQKQEPVAWEHFGIPSVNGKQAEQEPVVRNPTAAEVKAYRDKHCVSMMAAKSALINEQALKNKTIEQSPVAEVILRYHPNGFGRVEECKDIVFLEDVEVGTKLYTAPVRTKDLTDDEIAEITKDFGSSEYRINRIMCARAVIAADREKNRA